MQSKNYDVVMMVSGRVREIKRTNLTIGEALSYCRSYNSLASARECVVRVSQPTFDRELLQSR